jgi:hypothetical protein
MKVGELIEILRALPNREARVIVQNGETLRWLIATGIIERYVEACPDDPDFVRPGREAAIEIV